MTNSSFLDLEMRVHILPERLAPGEPSRTDCMIV